MPTKINVSTGLITDNAVTTGKIDDLAVTNDKLGNLSVTAAKIANATITNTQIGSATITGSNIAAGTIDTNNLAGGAVTNSILDTDAVTTTKILDGNVTEAKLADHSVSNVKLGTLGEQVSSSCGEFTTTSTTFVDVTNLSVTITTTGRPVMVALKADDGENASTLSPYASHVGVFGSGGSAGFYTIGGQFAILRGTTTISVSRVFVFTDAETAITNLTPPGSVFHIDSVSAGTYTYKLQIRSEGSSPTATTRVRDCKLVAFEL